MTHPAYIREKAIQMRVERDLTIDEIAGRLAISRQTIFYWVKDVPLKRKRSPRRDTPACRARDARNAARYKRLRVEAYEAGSEEYDDLIREAGFRDFVCMYIGEGYKRNRNKVSICNSSIDVMYLGEVWMRRFSRNPLSYSLQYHADQDPDALRRLWSDVLDIDPESIRLQRKSNSNQFAGRSWRSQYGVLAISAGDTYFRARLQAWMDRVSLEWLDLPLVGV